MSEGACPFCSVALDASFRAAPAPIGPSARLSRAALFAFSAGTAVLAPVVAIDCSTTSEPLYGGSAIAPYGAEPFPEGGYGVETDGGGRVAPDVSVGSPDASDASLATDSDFASADGSDASIEITDAPANDGSAEGSSLGSADGSSDAAPDDADSDAGSEGGA